MVVGMVKAITPNEAAAGSVEFQHRVDEFVAHINGILKANFLSQPVILSVADLGPSPLYRQEVVARFQKSGWDVSVGDRDENGAVTYVFKGTVDVGQDEPARMRVFQIVKLSDLIPSAELENAHLREISARLSAGMILKIFEERQLEAPSRVKQVLKDLKADVLVDLRK